MLTISMYKNKIKIQSDKKMSKADKDKKIAKIDADLADVAKYKSVVGDGGN